LWQDSNVVNGVKQSTGGVMKIFALATVVILTLSGCATTKSWSATGGSRADATVRLSYEYGAYENPQTNETEAINLATARCKTWGYTGAEAFGGVTQQCNMPGGMGGCQRFLVTKEFQCTGTGNKEPDAK
jgi:outer membrane lipoprotein SlyB